MIKAIILDLNGIFVQSPQLAQRQISLSEADFWGYWFKMEKVDDSLVDLAKKLRLAGYQLFILSNNFKERAEFYEHYPWLHEVIDRVYFSYRTGFAKPDPRAWTTILTEHNLQPAECLYFDDQDKNVSAANSLGIKSFLFTAADQFKLILKDNGVQWTE
jgi:putative hydrolase of the HAD superfamily